MNEKNPSNLIDPIQSKHTHTKWVTNANHTEAVVVNAELNKRGGGERGGGGEKGASIPG